MGTNVLEELAVPVVVSAEHGGNVMAANKDGLHSAVDSVHSQMCASWTSFMVVSQVVVK